MCGSVCLLWNKRCQNRLQIGISQKYLERSMMTYRSKPIGWLISRTTNGRNDALNLLGNAPKVQVLHYFL